MKPDEQRAVDECLRAVVSVNPDSEWAAILAGSVARDVATDRSDIDLVIVSEAPLKRPTCSMRVHVQMFTRDEFMRRLRERDDFALWCARFGVPLRESPGWRDIVASPDAQQWPAWQAKIPHAARRLVLASDLFRCGDLTAASEEALYAVAHVARAILLKAEVFPLSRPELPRQLEEQGQPMLARLMIRLLAHDEDPRLLRRAIGYMKRLLVHLDKDQFREFATRYAQNATLRTRARKTGPRG